MNNRPTLKLNFAKRTGLAIAGILAIAIPVILGLTNAPALRAQAQSDLRFEVASVRRVEVPATDRGVPVFFPTGGIGTSDPIRITYDGAWLGNLIVDAFGVRADQITGPEWLSRERYDALVPAPTVFDAVEQQLGLKLESATKSFPQFIIDSIDREPTDN